jgi:hypothetical protein
LLGKPDRGVDILRLQIDRPVRELERQVDAGILTEELRQRRK